MAPKAPPSQLGARSRMRTQLEKLVASTHFQFFITSVIVFNAIVLGIETCDVSDTALLVCNILDSICLLIYIVEMLIKLHVYGKSFFKSRWNVFDFVVVVAACIPAHLLPIPAQVARLFRLLRTLRALRLISAFKQIRIIVDGLLRALPGVFWTFVLLLIVFYIFAVIGVDLFGETFPELYGSLGSAFYTLFQVMTLESWSNGLARPMMLVHPMSWLYYVSFVIISSFILLNVVVGVVVSALDEANRHVNDSEEELRCQQTELTLKDIQSQLDSIESKLEALNAPAAPSADPTAAPDKPRKSQ